MGLWISYVGPLFSQIKYQQMLQNKPFPNIFGTNDMSNNRLRLFLTSHVTSAQKSNLQLSVRFRFQQVHFPNKVGLSSHIESNFKLYLIPVSYRPKRELLLNPANHLPTNHCHSATRTLQGPTLLLFIEFTLLFFGGLPFPLDLGDLVA